MQYIFVKKNDTPNIVYKEINIFVVSPVFLLYSISYQNLKQN